MEDTDSIVSYIRKIDTVEVACLLKEFEPKEIKVSLRSKEYVDVSKVCEKFDGGGHKRAAGCKIEKDIDEAERLLIKEIRNYLGD
jgi:bifunctional oligoribonuclease and PAP phosphatase NrnA